MDMRSDTGLEQDRATIHLHLGAHKTATTYIQAAFSRNARSLAANGIAYIPMREFRSWRRSLLRFHARLTAGPSSVKFDRRLRKWNPERFQTCIISDENMIGTCGGMVGAGKLYPQLRTKLGTVAGMVSEHELRLFISIRCYASFYAAAYCEALRYGNGCSAEVFKRRLEPASRRWRDVLAEIADLFPASPIVVWPYETFRQSQTEIFDALAGKEIAKRLHLPNEVLRPSPSQAAVDRAQKFGKRFGWSLAGRLVPVFESRAPGKPPFDLWTEGERDELRELYAGDMEEIGSDSRYQMIARYPAPARSFSGRTEGLDPNRI